MNTTPHFHLPLLKTLKMSSTTAAVRLQPLDSDTTLTAPLPEVIKAPIHSKNSREAGHQISAETWGTGLAVSRISLSGRIWRRWHNKIHSKHVQHSIISDNCSDRISRLPVDVLLHMLSFLPTKFAVTTSILSKRWRYLFTLTTRLSFQDDIFSGHNFIKIPLSARLPKLKILHLGKIMFVDFNSMERLFLSCKLLQKLTLEYCQCGTDGHATYRTGLLKVLTIRHCSFYPGTFEIDAPNLAHFKYSLNIGVKIVPSWKNSCSAYDDFDTKVDLPKYDHELLTAAASKATQLRFKTDTIELLFKLDEDKHTPEFASLSSVQLLFKLTEYKHMPEFASLSCVQVRLYPYYVREYATRLISKSPQLETIIFESCFPDCPNCSEDYTSEGCGSLLPSDIPQAPFSCDVQVIEVHKFCGDDSASRSLMGHLLRSASRLKTLIVHILSGCDLERDLEISKYLLMLPRASKGCRVEVKFGSGNTTLTSISGQR